MLRDLSALLTRRYMVFYDRDAVLDALRFTLPLERTTDVGHVMHLRNDTLRREAHVGVARADNSWASTLSGAR